MEGQNALVPIQKADEDSQVVAAWLFDKSEHTHARIAESLLDHAGKVLRAITLHDVQAYISSLTDNNSTIVLAVNNGIVAVELIGDWLLERL